MLLLTRGMSMMWLLATGELEPFLSMDMAISGLGTTTMLFPSATKDDAWSQVFRLIIPLATVPNTFSVHFCILNRQARPVVIPNVRDERLSKRPFLLLAF